MATSLSDYRIYREEIDKVIADSFIEGKMGLLVDANDLDVGGKRVRGLLTLLSCESISGNYRKALPVAAAYEMLHFASLVQDDIIDKGSTRRKKRSIPAKYGSAKALLISDICACEILRQLAKYNKMNVTKSQLCEIVDRLYKSLIATAYGETLDVTLGRRDNVTLNDYLEMISCKTGALFSAAAACGAILGKGSKEEIEICANFGEKQGSAFQIMDDLLDVISKPNKTGKPIFTDLKNRRVNVVILHFLLNSDELSKERIFISSLLGKKCSQEEINKAITIFKDKGSVQFASELALKKADEGKEYLSSLKPSFAKDKLLNLSNVLLIRDA